LQEHDALVGLLRVIAMENARLASPKPLLLKIAPDLSEESLGEIVGACEEFGLAGMIATNTTLDHAALIARDEAGGLSGVPLRARSNTVIRFLRSQTRLPIIGVGGVCDAVSAREKLEAGADLLQIYSGYIFRGPNLLREISVSLS
jgi:dihydroorotate dehydrogenase